VLPLLDEALRGGTISYSKTRAITRVATSANEATLIEMARHATASQLEKTCRGYRRVMTEQQRERPESLADEEQRRSSDAAIRTTAWCASRPASGRRRHASCCRRST
jgi:hypothetical protein